MNFRSVTQILRLSVSATDRNVMALPGMWTVSEKETKILGIVEYSDIKLKYHFSPVITY